MYTRERVVCVCARVYQQVKILLWTLSPFHFQIQLPGALPTSSLGSNTRPNNKNYQPLTWLIGITPDRTWSVWQNLSSVNWFHKEGNFSSPNLNTGKLIAPPDLFLPIANSKQLPSNTLNRLFPSMLGNIITCLPYIKVPVPVLPTAPCSVHLRFCCPQWRNNHSCHLCLTWSLHQVQPIWSFPNPWFKLKDSNNSSNDKAVICLRVQVPKDTDLQAPVCTRFDRVLSSKNRVSIWRDYFSSNNNNRSRQAVAEEEEETWCPSLSHHPSRPQRLWIPWAKTKIPMVSHFRTSFQRSNIRKKLALNLHWPVAIINAKARTQLYILSLFTDD